ncbi:hypothetical protein Btru_021247 [Bulinus truncatus]|nr:hypothetical protein Btru_021247 [Bulinus truncatus]
MASCVLISAIICVLITAVAVIVAFATPNWGKFQSFNGVCDCSNCDCGLWLQCAGGSNDGSIDNCKWYFTDEFYIEKKLPVALCSLNDAYRLPPVNCLAPPVDISRLGFDLLMTEAKPLCQERNWSNCLANVAMTLNKARRCPDKVVKS